jgi:hypothetical protein
MRSLLDFIAATLEYNKAGTGSQAFSNVFCVFLRFFNKIRKNLKGVLFYGKNRNYRRYGR